MNTRKRRENDTEQIFETKWTENVAKLMSDPKPQIQEAQKYQPA
jgi:hypothetical protein